MPSPNLFIIGAQKAGSTSLYEGLRSHPDIFMSPSKEPAIFLPLALRPPSIFGKKPTEEECWRIYLGFFSGAAGYRFIGEASPYYTMLPRYGNSAELIQAFDRDARILYIMRDPVERTISHYWSNVQHLAERRPPLAAIEAEGQYRSVSYYAMQLRPYLERFPRAQIWITTLEEFSANPATELERIFCWLGLDPSRAQPLGELRENGTPATIVTPRSRWLERLQGSAPYAALRELIPQSLRRAALGLAVRRIDRAHFDMQPVKEHLRPAQLRETEELSELLGHDFPQWKTLYAGFSARENLSGRHSICPRK